MEQRSDRLYPSPPLEKDNLEQRLEKKINDIHSFNNSIENIKEMTTYFKDNNHRSKRKYRNYKTLNKILEFVDTVVLFRATSTSLTIAITGIGLIILSKSTGFACTLSFGNKVLNKIFLNIFFKNKKQ